MPHQVGGPVPTIARQGRSKQKYGSQGERLVAGCLPLRLKPGGTAPSDLEILLITSRSGKGYVFPKGGWELDEILEIAARRETVEEAGVRGELEMPLLGAFSHVSSKYTDMKCTAYMFALWVSEELPEWPEKDSRTRKWCTLAEAHSLCRYDWMRRALEVWVERHGYGASALPTVMRAPDNTSTPSVIEALSATSTGARERVYANS